MARYCGCAWSLVVGALLALLTATASADTLVTLEPGAPLPSAPIFTAADFLDDPNGIYDIDDVSRGAQRDAFHPFPAPRLGDRVVQGWFRFRVRAAPDQAQLWALTTTLSCDTADLYTRRPDGTSSVTHFGMLVPDSRRPGDYRYPLVSLGPQQIDGKSLYLFISARQSLPTSRALFFLQPKEDVLLDSSDRFQRDSFFGGLFFAIIISNLFLWLYLRDRTFLAYVIAMALHVLTQFAQDAYAWKVFWPNASIPYAPIAVISELLFLAGLPLFWRLFLDLPRRYPILDRILLTLIALNTLRGILALTVAHPGWLVRADFPLAFGLIGVSLFAASRAMRDGYRPARFLIVALSGMLFCWICAFISFSIALPHGLIRTFMQNGLFYGTSWDALLLTFALADRIETSTRNMIDAQRTSERAKDDVLAAQAETLVRLQERDTAVSRFLPREFLQHLGRESVVDLQLGDHVECEMTILFSDIRSFTPLSESITPEQTFRLLNEFLRRTGPVIRENEGFVDKYIGDAIMGLFPNAPHTALDAAIGMQSRVRDYNQDRALLNEAPIAIGIGLHRGTLMLGTIGESERIETTVIADAVNIASRTEDLTKPFGASIIVSESVVAALPAGHRYKLRPLGPVIVKGSSKPLHVFEVYDGDPAELILSKNATLATFADGIAALESGDFTAAQRCFAAVLQAAPLDRPAAFLERRSRALHDAPAGATWSGSLRMDVPV